MFDDPCFGPFGIKRYCMSNASLAAPECNAPNPCSTIRDVADFHMHWSEFRPMAQSLCADRALSATQQDLLVWMIALLDRIGPQDIETVGN